MTWYKKFFFHKSTSIILFIFSLVSSLSCNHPSLGLLSTSRTAATSFWTHLESYLKNKGAENHSELLCSLQETQILETYSPDQVVINWRVFQDLSLLNGDQFSQEASIMQNLPIQPQTTLGFVQMANTLSKPLWEVEDLECRKSFINNFFVPENLLVNKSLEIYAKSHDRCLEFLFKDHSKDKNSCLNPKYKFYWAPLEKVEGISEKLTQKFCKLFKLEKFGFKPPVKKPTCFSSKEMEKQSLRFLDQYWTTLAVSWTFRIAFLSLWWFEDLQSTIEMLDNIFEAKFLEGLRTRVALPRTPFDGTASIGDDLARMGSGLGAEQDITRENIDGADRLKRDYPFFNIFRRNFLAHWISCKSNLFQSLKNWRQAHLSIISSTKFVKKSTKPIRAILKGAFLFYSLFDECSVAIKLRNLMKKDFRLFAPLLANFFAMARAMAEDVQAGRLKLDKMVVRQMEELLQNKTLLQLDKELKSFTLSWLNFPQGLRVYKLLYLARLDLVKLLCFYAQLEVFSCAHRLALLEGFCQPCWINSSRPQFKASGMWSLQLGQAESIKTSFHLQYPLQNVVITGSNAGGKSFFMRTIFAIILLAQSILVSPCYKIELTPFYKLYSFIKKEDDPANKLSLHWCECAEVANFSASIKDLKEEQFIFAIMDELFGGTSPDRAGELLSKFVNWASTQPHLLGLYTTHSTKCLTNLNFFDSKNVRFCKFGVNRDANKVFQSYRYNPEEGIASEAEDTAIDVAIMAGMDRKTFSL